MPKTSPFPELFHARPEWPNRDDEHLFWVGLNTRFEFAHHPVKGGNRKQSDSSDFSFFCRPGRVADQLISFLDHSNSGGSVLITGYRGTGKTSLVNYCLRQKEGDSDEDNRIIRVRVNMATVACANDVLVLTFDALIDRLRQESRDAKHKAKKASNQDGTESSDDLTKRLADICKSLFEKLRNLQLMSSVEHRQSPKLDVLPGSRPTTGNPPGVDSELSFGREALSRHQAGLVQEIQNLKLAWKGVRLVFVFDEVDKLMPVDDWADDNPNDESREVKKLASLQQIVAELKYFLSESPSHQIFIAGKDVDDSWAEDQNRGEGIFESIFASNINVASVFTLELEPCRAPLPQSIGNDLGEAEDFYTLLAGEMGIPRNSLVYRTALLILPHLAEYEIVQLLTRAYLREPQHDSERKNRVAKWLTAYAEDNPFVPRASTECPKLWQQPDLKQPLEITQDKDGKTRWFKLAPMSERTCRRLRILMEYLTYKGRGIPRKVLREFYAMVRPANCVLNDDPGYRKLWKKINERTDRYGNATVDDYKENLAVKHVLAFPQHHLQKMNFYASVVEHLDRNFALLRGLNDKGRVSIFHIIDYLLKFYATGFSHRDLEHAPFMTAREELFPSRQLAALILRIMDGKLWKRKDSRSPEYRMLHHVAHDLGVMFLRYGPEQMELRHTLKDFRDEVPRLQSALKDISGITADQRLAPIHAQLRLARIMELCGRHYEARLGYYCALRWLRLDVSHFEQAGAAVVNVRAQALRELSGLGYEPAPLIVPGTSAESVDALLHRLKLSHLRPGPPSHTPGFSVAFVSYTVESHLSLGRLLEEVGELRAAVHHYEEACALCEPYFGHQSATGNPADSVNSVSSADIPTYAHYGKALWNTLFEEPEIQLNTSQTSPSTGRRFDSELLAMVLARRPPMRPLRLAGIPQGYVQVCNQAAIAYSKLWERTSANAYFMRALVHLDETGDEYGLVEQMFFIGQVMVRRRDLVAAAFWYRSALLKSRAIRAHSTYEREAKSSSLREEQTGSGWQTPPVATTLDAQIVAALGDVIFATGGYAFFIFDPNHKDGFRSPKTDEEAQAAIWSYLRTELRQAHILKVDDRWEEFFFTQARRSFEAGEQDIEARDVYLRQLESRLYRFENAIGHLDQANEVSTALHQYTALNAWTTFWRGARVLLHRNLVAVTSLARDKIHTWGRISDFRRMGTTMRLIGSILIELGLRASDANSRKLLLAQSRELETKGLPLKSNGKSEAPVQFYRRFLGKLESQGIAAAEIGAAWRTMLTTILGVNSSQMQEAKLEETLTSRLNVNTAASDILTIFSYIGDRSDLLHTHLADDKSFEDVGGRSPLFRVNGDETERALPITKVYKSLQTKSTAGSKPDDADDVERRFKLLALAEKALLSSYLCYRDCIPDFSYAQSCVKMGELYAAALYKLGEWIGSSKAEAWSDEAANEIAKAILCFTEHGKRFLAKAIDILNREQEQNRNTFHLMSEAWFNLADIQTVRLLAVTGPTDSLGTELFGAKALSSKIGSHMNNISKQGHVQVDGSQNAKHSMRDLVPEDLRRQIVEAYQQGLRYVQSEMNDASSRYRVPGDVFYANRNVMDPVLHFRICRSIRLRHSGGRHDVHEKKATPEAIQDRFDEITHDICDCISGYESPQLSLDDKMDDIVGFAPSKPWASKLRELIKFANKVRTDRGPIQCDAAESVNSLPVTVKWLPGADLVKVDNRQQFVFFAGRRDKE